jgi:hypothetical protein
MGQAIGQLAQAGYIAFITIFGGIVMPDYNFQICGDRCGMSMNLRFGDHYYAGYLSAVV